MKKQLLKKLYACLPVGMAFIVTTMMFSVSANAQIVYTDVNPDYVISSANIPSTINYNIDLNNDGISDYKISCVRSGSVCQSARVYINYVTVSALNTNAVVAVTSTTYPSAMNFNDGILAGLPLSASGHLRYVRTTAQRCSGSTLGVWPNSIDRYLGLKLIVGANTYYGWVRMQVNVTGSAASCTIKDYAYNSIPNQPIRAGETSCTIPTASLTQSGSLSFCNGDSVTLTANGTGYLYQWKKNNVNITGATKQTYVAKTAGTYKCTVTNSCGSVTSSGKTVTVPCINTNTNASFLRMTSNELEHLSVYPNPTINSVTVKFPSDEDGEIQVVNLFGQIVYSEKVNAAQTQIDVSSFAAGMYVIRWSNGENFETKTFSVTK